MHTIPVSLNKVEAEAWRAFEQNLLVFETSCRRMFEEIACGGENAGIGIHSVAIFEPFATYGYEALNPFPGKQRDGATIGFPLFIGWCYEVAEHHGAGAVGGGAAAHKIEGYFE